LRDHKQEVTQKKYRKEDQEARLSNEKPDRSILRVEISAISRDLREGAASNKRKKKKWARYEALEKKKKSKRIADQAEG